MKHLYMACLSFRYWPSPKLLPEFLSEQKRSSGTALMKVNRNGYISLYHKRCHLNEDLAGKLLALHEG